MLGNMQLILKAVISHFEDVQQGSDVTSFWLKTSFCGCQVEDKL